MPATIPPYTIHVKRGDKFVMPFTWTHDDVPVNLTGWSAEFTLSFPGEEEPAVYDASPEVVIDALAGEVTVTLLSEVTAEWTISGSYRLRVLDVDDEPVSLIWGRWEVIQCLP